ncbi:MAG TPA: DUF2905 domain-containing protein [bacterium]|nr:DUF2905 domain-containing protein [bacterium]
MSDFGSFGKIIILLGIILVVLGSAIYLMGKYLPSGRLPGDIHIVRGNFSFYFPVITCIIISIVLTVIFNLAFRR